MSDIKRYEVPESFLLMELEDEKQIIAEYEGRVIKDFVYTTSDGKKGISYNGIKWIAQKLGYIKILPDSINLWFDERTERYGASVVAHNEKAHLQLPGMAYQEEMTRKKDGSLQLNPFAQRTALSKATRNAIRAVIPEPVLLKMMEDFLAKGKTSTGASKPYPSMPRKVVKNEFNTPIHDTDGVNEPLISDFTEDAVQGFLGEVGAKIGDSVTGENFQDYEDYIEIVVRTGDSDTWRLMAEILRGNGFEYLAKSGGKWRLPK